MVASFMQPWGRVYLITVSPIQGRPSRDGVSVDRNPRNPQGNCPPPYRRPADHLRRHASPTARHCGLRAARLCPRDRRL